MDDVHGTARMVPVDGAASKERTMKLLVLAASHPRTHGRLLNTLSLLEHTGSRKIMENLAVRKGAVTASLLKHLTEETRHAWFFKRAAERTLDQELSYRRSHLLGSRRTFSYIDRLNNYICRFVGRAEAYICTSYIVEIRANWFYGLYQEVLNSLGGHLSLKAILGDERAHLREMQSQIPVTASRLIEKFLNIENKLFQELLADLESCVFSSRHVKALPS